jgi:capsular polysaccharide biosynthesis protein
MTAPVPSPPPRAGSGPAAPPRTPSTAPARRPAGTDRTDRSVDIYEAGQAIVKRQWAIILLFILIGVAVPLAIDRLNGTEYVASARIDLGVPTTTGQESTAMADGVQGLATSDNVLATAVKQAHVQRDIPQMLIQQLVQVTPVGSSSVVDITVTDPDPRAAAVMANSLASQVVRSRDQAAYGSAQALLGQLQRQEATLNQQIAAVVAAAKQTSFALPGLQQQQSDLVAQRTAIDQQIQSLAQTLATAQHPQVINNSAPLGTRVPSDLKTLIPLGALLGLFLGVAVAATREAVRPTLDESALARHLGVPLLGQLPRRSKDAPPVDPWLASYVGAAADAAGVRTIQLIPVGRRPADVTALAAALDEAVDGVHVTALELPGQSTRHGGKAVPVPDRSDVGIVVVAPQSTKRKFLAALEQYLQVTRLPVVGVVCYRGRLSSVPRPGGDIDGELQTEVVAASKPPVPPTVRDQAPSGTTQPS